MRVGELIAAGRTADVYAFGRDDVIKVPRSDIPSHWAEIEADLGTAVHRHGLPAPEVRDVVVIDGQACVVFERIDGPSLWQSMIDDPSRVHELTSTLVALQRRIHRAGIPDGIPDLTSRLRSKIAACVAIDEHERDEAAQIASSLPRGAALLHGDLHPGNVLQSPEGPVVIDWFDAAIGHPAADVFRTSLLLRLGFEGDQQQRPRSGTNSLLAQTRTAYLDAWSELSLAGDREWEPVLALARISEGVEEEVAALLELWNQRPVPSR